MSKAHIVDQKTVVSIKAGGSPVADGRPYVLVTLNDGTRLYFTSSIADNIASVGQEAVEKRLRRE